MEKIARKASELDTRQLRTFLKIAELGSITAAADALDLAQPSLSQQLIRLEDEVGMKLFRRTTRGVTTTEAGRVFEEYARDILRSIDQALEGLRQLKSEPTGVAIFAMPPSVCGLVGPVLSEAALRHAAGVSLCLREAMTGHIRAWLDEGSIDLGILHDTAPLRHLSFKPLVREELFLVGAPERLPGIEAGPFPVAELGALPLIVPSTQHGLRQFLEREAHRLGFEINVRLEVDSLSLMIHLVSSGYGHAVLPLSVVNPALAAKKVSAARIEGAALTRTLYLVRNPKRVVTRAAVRIEDLSLKLMRQMVNQGRWQAEPGAALGG